MNDKSSEDQSIEHTSQFVGMPAKITEILKTESDRGTILILSGYLEEILGLIIRASCVTDSDGAKILKFRGPAGGFDLRIQLCKAFAFIHEYEFNALNAVRSIRNPVAHFDEKRHFNVLFDSESTIAQVENLAKALSQPMKSREVGDVRTTFVICCRLLATQLFTRLLQARRAVPSKTIKQLANEVRNEHRDTDYGKLIGEIDAAVKKGDLADVVAFMKAMNAAIGETLRQDEEVSE